jgi:steroid 5-alpha reductase family enzyme
MGPYLLNLGVILGYMSGCYALSLIRGRNDLADIAWGPGFILVVAASLLAEGVCSWRGLLLSGLTALWGLRLALHIHARNRGRGEDPRYRQWREAWGRWFALRSFLQVFMLQGLLLVIVALPVIHVNASPSTPFSALDLLGLLIWLAGFLFEAVGDGQLLAFMRNPKNKGKLMTAGLWRYTRHPNYFGEVTLWWGVWLIACGAQDGWRTIIGPLTLTLLILKVSGIPMLERRYAGRADFAAYKRRTSAFLPLPPRDERSSS